MPLNRGHSYKFSESADVNMTNVKSSGFPFACFLAPACNCAIHRAASSLLSATTKQSANKKAMLTCDGSVTVKSCKVVAQWIVLKPCVCVRLEWV